MRIMPPDVCNVHVIGKTQHEHVMGQLACERYNKTVKGAVSQD